MKGEAKRQGPLISGGGRGGAELLEKTAFEEERELHFIYAIKGLKSRGCTIENCYKEKLKSCSSSFNFSFTYLLDFKVQKYGEFQLNMLPGICSNDCRFQLKN